MSALPAEIISYIIDLSASPREVVPWLSVSHRVRALARHAPAYAQHITWPPHGCTFRMPCHLGLISMLDGCLPSRTLELSVVFNPWDSIAYVALLKDAIRNHALRQASSLRLCFTGCFKSPQDIPHLATFLDAPAPSLAYFAVFVQGLAPRLDELPAIQLFNGHAPSLRNVRFEHLQAPMYRIPAFDGVRRLTVRCASGFVSSSPSETFLCGCSDIHTLDIMLAANLPAIGHAFTYPELRNRVAGLRELIIHIPFQRETAMQLLAYFGGDHVKSICASGDREQFAFPRGFVCALIRSLSELHEGAVQLSIRRSPNRYRFQFEDGTAGRSRCLAVDSAAPSWRAQVSNLARELDTPLDVLTKVTRINASTSLLPVLALLSASKSSFIGLKQLSLVVDHLPAVRNGEHKQLPAPSLSKVTLLVAASDLARYHEPTHRRRAFDVLRSWVDVRDTVILEVEVKP